MHASSLSVAKDAVSASARFANSIHHEIRVLDLHVMPLFPAMTCRPFGDVAATRLCASRRAASFSGESSGRPRVITMTARVRIFCASTGSLSRGGLFACGTSLAAPARIAASAPPTSTGRPGGGSGGGATSCA
jgi:hypothetical protein